MKKLILSCFLFCLVVGNVFAKDDKQKHIIATASAGGTYYPVGMGIATIASMKLSNEYNKVFSAVTSAGSVENITMLQKGEADFAIIQGLIGSMAWQGKAKYKNNVKKNLRAISMLWYEVEQFAVTSKYAKTGNIQDMKNLYGKKFSIGGRNSGARVSTEIILDTLGIEYGKMDLQYLGYLTSANAFNKGEIEGMNTSAGVPTSAMCNVFIKSGPEKIKVLEFTKEDLLTINENYPVWSPFIIKAGVYPEQKHAIHTIAQPSLLVTTKDISEDTVYLLTKTIYENLPFLHEVHDVIKTISLSKATVGIPMTLHPGAVRYYEEKGIKIPSSLKE